MNLVNRDWYQSLVEDCAAIITESVFTSRWALIEGYHQLGLRIMQENGNFKREKVYGKEIVQGLAKSLNKSPRTVRYSMQFVKKFPDLQKLPDGKNISWSKIVTNYLPESVNGEVKKAKEITCPNCQHQFEL